MLLPNCGWQGCQPSSRAPIPANRADGYDVIQVSIFGSYGDDNLGEMRLFAIKVGVGFSIHNVAADGSVFRSFQRAGQVFVMIRDHRYNTASQLAHDRFRELYLRHPSWNITPISKR